MLVFSAMKIASFCIFLMAISPYSNMQYSDRCATSSHLQDLSTTCTVVVIAGNYGDPINELKAKND